MGWKDFARALAGKGCATSAPLKSSRYFRSNDVRHAVGTPVDSPPPLFEHRKPTGERPRPVRVRGEADP
eukprot:tig00020660_g12506.t1